MSLNAGLLSSQTSEWETPQGIFNVLNAFFNFTLDPCATGDNAKCPRYFTADQDGLSQCWAGEIVFMNPPYGREISKWVRKAYEESRCGVTVVCLLPARTDTAWFHDYCMRGEIEFIRGRLKFGGAKWNAPFPSMIVVFEGEGKYA